MREVLSEEIVSKGVTEDGVPYTHTRRKLKGSQRVETRGPSMFQKGINFGKALLKHVLNGSPRSTSEAILKRLEVCQSCPMYKVLPEKKIPKHLQHLTVGTCMHKSCGCYLHKAEVFPNKLAWADQECPLQKWGREDNLADPHYLPRITKVSKPNE